MLNNLKIQNETEKLLNDFDKNLVETIEISKKNSAKLAHQGEMIKSIDD